MLLFLLSCAYSTEDYWSDLSKAHCQCEQEQAWRECRSEWMEYYASTAYWDGCRDEPSPVPRDEVKDWVKDYTETCLAPDEPLDEPADPEWFEACK